MAAMNTDPRPVGPGRPAPATDPLRILLVAPPMLPVPPPSYAGTERVVAALGDELHRRGHHVALVAPGDSKVPYEHIRTIDESLWSAGYSGRLEAFQQHTIEVAWRAAERFDIVHAHMEQHSFVFAEHCSTPVITTLHGRLDTEGMPELLDDAPERPAGRHQREPAPVLPGPALDRDDPPRPAARRDAVPRPAGGLPGVRGTDHAREGHRGRDRAQPRDGDPAQGRGQGPPRVRAPALPRRRAARHRRRGDRLPGRARARGARSALRRRAGDGDAGRLAGAVRAGRDRVDGDRDARDRAPGRRAHRDRDPRGDRLHRGRRGRGRARGRAGRGAGSHEDPRGRARPVLAGADDRPVRGGVPMRSWPTPGRTGRAAERPPSGSRRCRGRRARRTRITRGSTTRRTSIARPPCASR